MQELKKIDPVSMMLANMMGNGGAPQIPQMNWGTSCITDYIMMWKARRMDKYMERMANIYENYSKVLTSQTNIITTTMTMQEQIDSRRAVLTSTAKIYESWAIAEEQKAEQEKVKTNTMITEYQIQQLTYQKMKDEVKDDSAT